MKSAIGAVFAHNFRRDFTGHANAQRTYESLGMVDAGYRMYEAALRRG